MWTIPFHVFLEGKTFSLIMHRLIWSHLSNCGSTCMGVGHANKSVISLISNKECASKRNVVNPVLCVVLTQLGFFCKNCDFTLSVILRDPGSVSWVGKKARRKFSSRPVLENYQWDLFENSFVDFISILVVLLTSTNGHFLTTANCVRRPFFWADSLYIHSCFNLSTMATCF